MQPQQSQIELDTMSSTVSSVTLLLWLLAAIGGAFGAIFILPIWIPGLRDSLIGSEPKAYWYLSRVSGLVAYTLLWFSMILGLLMTNRLAKRWPGGVAAFALHEHVSLLALAFSLFHALILLGDRYISYTFVDVFIPFSNSNYRPLSVGLGQIGFSMLLVVGLSFYVRQHIGRKTWRFIHFGSFGMFLLALFHGIWSGTDSTSGWVQWLYWVSGSSVLFLTMYRIVQRGVFLHSISRSSP
ncbi:MAG: putative ferric reductase [Chloroflexi bacterium AL-W]|nr:putative ferric reductase [Chloroflexi bacterium AL-N1]NOK70716.1 putative ferric reductase [Chloroflexi bacterium AL-N10]NOK78276.1 putative ferric reductase [Chloroflexi bacterium AL-N5]NOK85619.1 putative ferric reductase [Chloroflexi bacterium AL-W]NOK92533.1 putative ferric reductase [Chloroflexi bacterium AL-N15]